MNLTCTQVQWDERLEKLFIEFNPGMGVPAVACHVKAGHFRVYEVFCDDVSVGFFVVRVDVDYSGVNELVHLFSISPVKGKVPIHHVMASLVPDVARSLNCKRVRVHSEIRKIDVFLERSGFEFMESVFIKEIE